jgi:hypothetical protein
MKHDIGLLTLVLLSLGFLAGGCDCGGGGASYTDGGALGTDGVAGPEEAGGPPADAGGGGDSAWPDTDVPDSGGADGGERPYPCFDPAPPGEYAGVAGCFDVFSSCEPSKFLLVKNGASGGMTQEEMVALKDLVEDEVMVLPDVDIFGLTKDCCKDTTNAACYYIHLRRNTDVTIDEMAASLSGLDPLCDHAACFAFAISIPAKSGPRCEASDPSCLPIPMCKPDRCPEGISPDPGCCPECRPYDPAAPMVRSIGSDPGALLPADYENLEVLLEETDGECAHDGDCVQNGCGQYCGSFEDRGFISTCECYPKLSVSYCGCVDTRCRWFHQ